jgi:hypothetical protein
MWKQKLDVLAETYPEVIKTYKSATATQIRHTEHLLDFRLTEVEPTWSDFLRSTNGASLLDYCLLEAESTVVESISNVNRTYWDLDIYHWMRDHFICFLTDSSPMNIGFVRVGQRVRCVACLADPTDTAVLPIASSFEAFLKSFLDDVETTPRLWIPASGERRPYGISDIWSLDLASWSRRDRDLRTLLRQGALDDLFEGDEYYSKQVNTIKKR